MIKKIHHIIHKSATISFILIIFASLLSFQNLWLNEEKLEKEGEVEIEIELLMNQETRKNIQSVQEIDEDNSMVSYVHREITSLDYPFSYNLPFKKDNLFLLFCQLNLEPPYRIL